MAETLEGHDDWRGVLTAKECLQHLYLSENLSDVAFTFNADGACKILAHKFVLSMSSAVFEAMFYGSMATTTKEILLPDDDPETFKLILRYIYTGTVELNGDVVLKCLYSAKKYCLDGLVQKCSEFLQQSISKTNACMLYEQAKLYDMTHLMFCCYSFIVSQADQVFKADDFLQISKETLEKIIVDNELNSDELSIFQAAVRWSKNHCISINIEQSPDNIRQTLGETLYKIRFPLIPMAAFASSADVSTILTNEEQVELYRYIATKGQWTGNKVGNFSRQARIPKKAKGKK